MADSDAQLKIKLDTKLHMWFKILTTREGTKMNTVCNELIRQWVIETAKKTDMKIDLD